MRQSIQPTYDHRETGDRFTVETRVSDRRISVTPTRHPFVNHRVTVGWRDLLSGLIHRRLIVEVLVGGDHQIVDDVMELDADCLTSNSTRRDEWNAQVRRSLGDCDLPVEARMAEQNPDGTYVLICRKDYAEGAS